MWDIVRPWIFPVACLGCDRPGVAFCTACAPAPSDRVRDVIANTALVAAGSYDGNLRRAIVALKRGERAYLEPFTDLIVELVAPNVPLVPLPTARSRRAARGFDQAVELARRAAHRSGGVCCDILRKCGPAQSGRDRRTRLAAGGRFAIVRDAALPELAIVVDDVCTTGATIADGIATLRAGGVAVIGAVVLARTAAGRNFVAHGTVMPPGPHRSTEEQT